MIQEKTIPTTNSKKIPQLPDFLIIGAGKSGTTSLDKYLNQHPQIYISRVKEPNFFGYERSRIEDFNGNLEEINHYKGSITTIDKYKALFEDALPHQIKGETSNTYMYHPDAPARIKHYIPDAKLIAVLRQPAGRLYSRFLHLARENRLPTPKFEDCLDKNTIWWKRNDLIREGFYYKNLKPYYDLFPKQNIRVFLYEDLQQHAAQTLVEIYKFLGVDTSFIPDLSVRYNESGYIKSKFLHNIYGPGGLVSKSIRAVLPTTMIQKIKGNLTLYRKVTDIRSKNLSRPSMDPAIRKQLTHDVYGDDIKNLGALIGRDLSHWLKA